MATAIPPGRGDDAAIIDDFRPLLARAMRRDALWAASRLDQAAERARRGAPVDRILDEVAARLDGSIALAEERAALADALAIRYPEALPVSQRRDEILASLRRQPVLVLTGETGSGKTTQLPKMLLEAGHGRRGRIALTQPRRVAAVAMAERIAEELDAPAGAIAHSVRFDDRAGPATLVRVMTDGLLLAEVADAAAGDFADYDAILVDEAHERSLNIDLLLGLLRRARERRPDLAVVVASASIEAERFAAFFAAPIIAVSGRAFPVEIRHQPPADDDVGYLDAALRAIREAHAEPRSGDVLCFLPTERDILDARRRLDDLAAATVLPLFSRLNPGEQRRVFQAARGRKIVLATNIAETSLTIPGITTVIDTGLARMKRYQASSRTERLPIEPIAQASATQRAGRAGRVAPGVCIRLYDAADLAGRPPFAAPEILRSNLAGVLLACLHLGLGDAQAFPWLDPPSPHAWDQARGLLDELGALAAGEPLRLSALGRTLARIPADPQVARILVAGLTEGVPQEACTIAAFLSVQDPRVRPLGQEARADAAHRGIAHEAGDLAAILVLWDRWQQAGSAGQRRRLCQDLFLGERRMREWSDVRHQLWSSLRASHRQAGGDAHPPGAWPLDGVHRAVLAGMLGNVMLWDAEERAYRAAGDRRLAVHPGSALRSGKGDDGKRAPPPPPWLVACEVVETSRLFARLCAPIDPAWVAELAGDRLRLRHRDPHYHPQRRQVVCVETALWKGLPVRDHRLVPFARIDPEAAAAIFAAEAMTREEGVESLPELPVLAANRRVLAEAGRLRHRLRDPGLFVDEAQLTAIYRERLGPARPAAAAELAAWAAAHGADRLAVGLADLVEPALAERAARELPERIRIGGLDLHLRWRFAPGEDDDGATATVAESDLGRLDPAALDAAVPGWIAEQVALWLERLPKDARRALIPQAESAAALTAAVRARLGQAPVAELLAEAIRQRTGRAVAIDHADLPDWLRLRFRVLDAEGHEVYAGRDRAAVLAQAGAAADRLRPLRRIWDTAPTAGWPGDCPGGRQEELGIAGFVAVARARAADGTVAARRTVFASEAAARAWHEDGLDAAIESALAGELAAIATAPVPPDLADACQRHLGVAAGTARRQCALLAALEPERSGVRTAADAERLIAQARAAAVPAGRAADQLLRDLGRAVAGLRGQLGRGAKSLAAAGIQRALGEELDRLLGPGWPTRRFWSATVRLPQAVDALAARYALAARDPAAATRLSERAAALIGALDHAEGEGDPRLIDVLGERRRWRRLHGLHVACVAALGGARGGMQAEAQLRVEAAELARHQQQVRGHLADIRGRLVAARMTAGRLASGAGKRLAADLDHFLVGFPDLGLLADLDAQCGAAAALLARLAAVR